jgi:hypothetical protein
MRWLLFISRVALLCNLCFIVCVTIRYTHDFINNQDVNNYIIILGWYASFVINFIVNILSVIMLIQKKDTLVPLWLTTVNLLFFIFQVIYFFS